MGIVFIISQSRSTVITAILAVLFLSTSLVFAGEETDWKFSGEVRISLYDKYLDESAGGVSYEKAVSTQSVEMSVGRGETGFYLEAENYAPFEKQENKETDFSVGFYTQAKGMRFDLGYRYDWLREKGVMDCHAFYGSVDFPEIGWGVVPFTKVEYMVFPQRLQDEADSISLDGFVYQAGLKRKFKVTERIGLDAQIVLGGNTGIYGYKAENLAFVREKAEVWVALTGRLNIRLYGMTQQNIGKEAGIASGTDKLFVGSSISWGF